MSLAAVEWRFSASRPHGKGSPFSGPTRSFPGRVRARELHFPGGSGPPGGVGAVPPVRYTHPKPLRRDCDGRRDDDLRCVLRGPCCGCGHWPERLWGAGWVGVIATPSRSSLRHRNGAEKVMSRRVGAVGEAALESPLGWPRPRQAHLVGRAASLCVHRRDARPGSGSFQNNVHVGSYVALGPQNVRVQPPFVEEEKPAAAGAVGPAGLGFESRAPAGPAPRSPRQPRSEPPHTPRDRGEEVLPKFCTEEPEASGLGT